MIVLWILGGWSVLSVLCGLWIGAVIRQGQHETRLADIYRRQLQDAAREARLRASLRNGRDR